LAEYGLGLGSEKKRALRKMQNGWVAGSASYRLDPRTWRPIIRCLETKI
jgi:hypothetical protein